MDDKNREDVRLVELEDPALRDYILNRGGKLTISRKPILQG